jgi:SSS family solute:Na+ symporter
VLSGLNQREARRGAILGSYFKLLPVFIFMIPGMIAYALSQKGLLSVSTSDSAFASMVSQLLPVGFKGVVVCGLLAALMSSLASLYNSSAALFVGDFYKKMIPNASEHHYLIIGRIATATVVILGVGWIPVMLGLGKVLYEYLQAVQGLLAPAIATVFLLGVFWKRTSTKGALWGMILGFTIGMFRLGLNIFLGAKAGLVTEAQKLYLKIQHVTEYTREALVGNLHNLADKISQLLPADQADSFQSSLQRAAGSMAVITPEGKANASTLLTQVSTGLEKLFTDQYGFFFHVAAVNQFNFTALLFFFCIATVVIVSLFTAPPPMQKLNYTYFTASAEDKALTRASWNKWDVLHTLIIVSIFVTFYVYFW